MPYTLMCGLFVGFLGCSEKSDSCFATICWLKSAVYFSDIKKILVNFGPKGFDE
ncbi:hypothetical protein HYT26_04515 [Candidatus Pacearchaeota archaeon]|nr:hypothetical protein [Candidatus Pacearchaeota archaeon]